MKKIIPLLSLLFVFVFSALVYPGTSFAADTSPRSQVESTINKIIKIVEENAGDENRQARREDMRVVIDERFDFEEMAKRSLGSNWKKASPEQQKEFVATFSELLINTYIERLENVKPGMVSIDAEKIRAPKALIKTKIQVDQDKFPIDYKLIKRGANWEVYDVIIENIGLISNYRSEFAGIIRKEKMAGLLTKLKEKVDKS